MPEILQTLKSIRKKEEEERRFTASLQGVDLDDAEQESGPTFEDVRRKSLGINASGDDVVSLQGVLAAETGFGIGLGLGYTKG